MSLLGDTFENIMRATFPVLNIEMSSNKRSKDSEAQQPVQQKESAFDAIQRLQQNQQAAKHNNMRVALGAQKFTPEITTQDTPKEHVRIKSLFDALATAGFSKDMIERGEFSCKSKPGVFFIPAPKDKDQFVARLARQKVPGFSVSPLVPLEVAASRVVSQDFPIIIHLWSVSITVKSSHIVKELKEWGLDVFFTEKILCSHGFQKGDREARCTVIPGAKVTFPKAAILGGVPVSFLNTNYCTSCGNSGHVLATCLATKTEAQEKYLLKLEKRALKKSGDTGGKGESDSNAEMGSSLEELESDKEEDENMDVEEKLEVRADPVVTASPKTSKRLKKSE